MGLIELSDAFSIGNKDIYPFSKVDHIIIVNVILYSIIETKSVSGVVDRSTIDLDTKVRRM